MQELANIGTRRVRAGATANIQDAALWRWYADLMEDNRVACVRKEGTWSVWVDGRLLASDRSYDLTLRTAFVMQRALRAL